MKKLLLFLLLSTAGYAQLNIPESPDIVVCDTDGDGITTFDLTIQDAALLGGLPPSQYSVAYFETESEANFNANAIFTPENYVNTVAFSQSIYAKVQSITDADEFATTEFKLIVNTAPVLVNIQPLIAFDNELPYEDLTTQVNLTAYIEELASDMNIEGVIINFYTSLEDSQNNTNPILSANTYSVTEEDTIFYVIQNAEGCSFSSSFTLIVLPGDYETPAPIAPVALTFTEGDTLGDIELEGENILWYSTDGTITLPPDPDADALPSTTVLEDGKTYYATQTVYGIESNDRLPVTVNFTLGLDNIAFKELQYFPNPVKNSITINNNNEIESVTILNSLGQTLNSTIVRGGNIEADLSYLSSGIYFIKLASGNHYKTLKIIKE
ncbi:hypothetical protein AMR72_08670 [Flavobacterium psychrophilum]|nr:hypothetical protein AMR72_08670 [Flavobacterium psychrophilum]AOE52570.1 hypothetical protein ALW18_08660 [Flavobacterium psychrophilum]